jgi:hypothetical protein
MEAIVVAFTLKGQDQSKIFQRLIDVAENNPNKILIHGFLPRKIVEEKNIPTDVVDTLEALFPVQLNMFDKAPLRAEMVEVAKKLNAKVYIIGEVKEGVKEEADLYNAASLEIIHLPLP